MSTLQKKVNTTAHKGHIQLLNWIMGNVMLIHHPSISPQKCSLFLAPMIDLYKLKYLSGKFDLIKQYSQPNYIAFLLVCFCIHTICKSIKSIPILGQYTSS